MPWSNAEKAAVKIAQKALHWEQPQYELVLRNIAGIRPWLGKISSTNPSADHAGFVRFMAFAERHGFVDAKHGQGYWSIQATKDCVRMHWVIRDLAGRAERAGVLAIGALGGFIARMTAQRPPERGGPTTNLDECDWEYSYNVLEGLKAWVRRESRDRKIELAV